MKKFSIAGSWFVYALLTAAASGQQLLPNGQQQFADSQGVPLAGGQVFFYVPGTTQAKFTYQDPGQTVPNTNPVILDAAGRATIWGTGLYREVLYDGNGVLIWDQLTYGGAKNGLNGGFGPAVSVASASTTDIGATAIGHNASITGSTTIVNLGSSADTATPIYLLRFTGSLVLTNSTSLALPTGANITTAAGDVATAEYLGSGNWRIREYYRVNGAPLKVTLSGDVTGSM